MLPVGDAAAVHAAWALHARLVRRSLERGFYQGWDLHPASCRPGTPRPSPSTATAAESAAARLRAYVERSDSGYLDEPATAVALAGFVLRGVECGAVDDAEVADKGGLDRAALARLARRTTPP